MIKTEREYELSARRVREAHDRLARKADAYKGQGYTQQEIDRLLEAERTFHAGIEWEVDFYERLRRGELEVLHGINSLGILLIALRIASGITQRELATKLGVNPSLVSRDESNEYHGITKERAARVLEALGAEVDLQVTRFDRDQAETKSLQTA